MQPPRIPKYRHQKSRNLAVVRIDGKDIYLGKYNSPESHEKYQLAIAELVSRLAITKTKGLTLPALAAVYHQFSQIRFSDAKLRSYHRTIQRFASLFPELDSQDVACSHVEAFQMSLVQRNLTAKTINDYLARLKNIFCWASRNKYMPAQNLLFFDMLDRVDNTWPGVRQTDKVKPVSLEQINEILTDVPKTVAALIKFQFRTACRPSEARMLRLCDIEKSDDVWLYCPPKHKTSHQGKQRRIPLGPLAQQVIESQQVVDPSAYVFHSGDPSQPYKKDSYSRAIRRACERAGIDPHWTPNQIRHTAATSIRAEYGIEVTQVVLGHSHVRTTEIYAEKNMDLAIKAAMKIG